MVFSTKFYKYDFYLILLAIFRGIESLFISTISKFMPIVKNMVIFVCFLQFCSVSQCHYSVVTLEFTVSWCRDTQGNNTIGYSNSHSMGHNWNKAGLSDDFNVFFFGSDLVCTYFGTYSKVSPYLWILHIIRICHWKFALIG